MEPTIMETIEPILAIIGAIAVMCFAGLLVLFFTVYKTAVIIPVEREQKIKKFKVRKPKKTELSEIKCDDLIN